MPQQIAEKPLELVDSVSQNLYFPGTSQSERSIQHGGIVPEHISPPVYIPRMTGLPALLPGIPPGASEGTAGGVGSILLIC